MYPNGHTHNAPYLYPEEALDDIIKQFAHPESEKRMGVVASKHSTSTMFALTTQVAHDDNNQVTAESLSCQK
jgi:hypothetical protein